MATISARPSNGVTFGYKHTVTSTDATDTYVILDFQVDYPLAASVTVLTETTGAVVDPTGMLVTFPADGQIKVANGGSLTLTVGQVISVIAQRDNALLDY